MVKAVADEREGRHTVDNVGNLRVDGVRPHLDLCQAVVAARDLGGEGGVAKLGFACDPFVECRIAWDLGLAGLHLGPVSQQAKCPHEGGETVDSPSLRVKVYELPYFPGIFTDRLQAVVLGEHRREALLLLDLQRVKHAAVGVDADKKTVARLEVVQHLGGVAHAQALYVLEETSPPWPVQLVWKNSPRSRSVRSYVCAPK